MIHKNTTILQDSFLSFPHSLDMCIKGFVKDDYFTNVASLYIILLKCYLLINVSYAKCTCTVKLWDILDTDKPRRGAHVRP